LELLALQKREPDAARFSGMARGRMEPVKVVVKWFYKCLNFLIPVHFSPRRKMKNIAAFIKKVNWIHFAGGGLSIVGPDWIPIEKQFDLQQAMEMDNSNLKSSSVPLNDQISSGIGCPSIRAR
jgi:hypothetical protein